MRGAHADPNGTVTDLEAANAMLRANDDDVEAFSRLGENRLTLRCGDARMRLILERCHRLTAVMITHPTLETDCCAGGGSRKRSLELGGIDRIFDELECRADARLDAHRSTSAAGNGRKEQDDIAVVQRRLPLGELVVDGDLAA